MSHTTWYLERSTFVLSAAFLAALLSGIWTLLKRPKNTKINVQQYPLGEDPYNDIEPLRELDWRRTAKRKIWKLKPKYFLTMGLESLPSLSDLVALDETYLDRIQLRKDILDANPKPATHDVLPAGADAVHELYSWLVQVYLPKRFPTVYTLKDGALHNKATGENLPLAPGSPLDALRILGENIDNEFLILKPTSTAEDGSPLYHLQAYITLSPAGFDLREKLGLSLADIHKPVPSYKERLEKSMNRFFTKMEPGKAVLRTNWSVTRNSDFFVLSGNHVYSEGPEDSAEQQAEIERAKSEVVAKDCRLRCERQTLHRLPVSKALVFSFKTYIYTLDEVKAEGPETVEQLAQAIEGLDKGNAPGMIVYKSAVIWKDAVLDYLRS